MYQANFLNIPDSISSNTAGTVKQVINVNRLVLKVDGIIQADSSKTYFTPNTTSVLTFDYVTAGSHSIQLLVYGQLVGNTNWLLYSGTTTINVSGGNDSTVTFPLTWIGPITGVDSTSIIIGKVGKVTLNGTLPSNVIN